MMGEHWTFEVGDKVTYTPSHGDREYGVIKSIAEDLDLFIVYKCNDDWANYRDYTACKTDIADVTKGWK